MPAPVCSAKTALSCRPEAGEIIQNQWPASDCGFFNQPLPESSQFRRILAPLGPDQIVGAACRHGMRKRLYQAPVLQLLLHQQRIDNGNTEPAHGCGNSKVAGFKMQLLCPDKLRQTLGTEPYTPVIRALV